MGELGWESSGERARAQDRRCAATSHSLHAQQHWGGDSDSKGPCGHPPRADQGLPFYSSRKSSLSCAVTRDTSHTSRGSLWTPRELSPK